MFIVGGVLAQPGEFPYMISLASAGEHACGGVLLNAYTVITDRGSGGKQVNVSEMKWHPNFDAGSFQDDIALWHLETPIRAEGNISFVKLPVQDSVPHDGMPATGAGWGYLNASDLDFPAKLHKFDVPVVGLQECEGVYGTTYITDSMFCAGFDEGGKDWCFGDEGGPLINSESKTLIGLMSWGYGCGEPGFPSVYTRVGKLVNWINENKWTSV